MTCRSQSGFNRIQPTACYLNTTTHAALRKRRIMPHPIVLLHLYAYQTQRPVKKHIYTLLCTSTTQINWIVFCLLSYIMYNEKFINTSSTCDGPSPPTSIVKKPQLVEHERNSECVGLRDYTFYRYTPSKYSSPLQAFLLSFKRLCSITSADMEL